MKTNLGGLHHVTAIASDPQRNLDFYVGTLGLRLVKRTINFDDPGSFHFYFGDGAGSPGTILTFFPWPQARRGQRGTGEVDATAFHIPAHSTNYWLERLKQHRVPADRGPDRFGEEVIRLADPDGMIVELIPSTGAPDVTAWPGGPIAADQSIRGFHGVTATLRDSEPTAKLLTEVFGYRQTRDEYGRRRFVATGSNAPGDSIDLITQPEVSRGRQSAGSVHHIAFRVPHDEAQTEWRGLLRGLGFQVSEVMDRTYFHSIYFREPGGILFEIATDGPGFAVDEPAEALGSRLCLPPWLEESRPAIESSLPRIHIPTITEP